MIVCIPTKGRPKTQTYKLFEAAGYQVLHFVEPQEIQDYPDNLSIVSIEKDDQGITYARNFILDYCNDLGEEWIWIADDDISGFGIYNGKTVKKDASVLQEIEQKAAKLPFELVGLNYCQHAWHEKTSYSVNKKWVEVCALIKVNSVSWRYREGKEDRDFVMQTIQNGHGVLRFNHIWFNCPDVGSNKGGLHDWYESRKDREAAAKMVTLWDPWAKLKVKGDRIDAKVDIAGFARSLRKPVK